MAGPGVALEFSVLLLTLCYVSSFGLHDMRRLLDRPPPSTHASDLRHTVEPLASLENGALAAALQPPLPAPPAIGDGGYVGAYGGGARGRMASPIGAASDGGARGADVVACRSVGSESFQSARSDAYRGAD